MNLEELKLSLTGMDRCDPASATSWYGAGVYSPEVRQDGHDWPATAVTMIGMQRLSNLQVCIESVLSDDIPGDLIETGVWRGGACILMQGVLRAHGSTDRTVWVADSFQGLPPDAPEGWVAPELSVPLSEVQDNFRYYGLLDGQVRFLPGWFCDTLPGPVGQLAVLRLDGDYYSSTMDVLTALYPKLSVGGYLIVDDWVIGECRQAVNDYRGMHGITEAVQLIDWAGAYWRREH